MNCKKQNKLFLYIKTFLLLFYFFLSFFFTKAAFSKDILNLEKSFFCLSNITDNNRQTPVFSEMDWQHFYLLETKSLNIHSTLYMKVPLSGVTYKKPAIYIKAYANRLSVYKEDGNLFYQNDADGTPVHFIEKVISINPGDADRFLYLKVTYYHPSGIGHIESLYTGEVESLLFLQQTNQKHAFKTNFPDAILFSLFSFIGLISLFCVFFIKKELRGSFIAFGTFSLLLSIRYLCSPLLHLFFNICPMQLSYIEFISFLLVPVPFFQFIKTLFFPQKNKLIHALWATHLAFALFFILMLHKIYIYEKMIWALVFFTLTTLVSFFSILYSKNKEIKKFKPPLLFFLLFFFILLINEIGMAFDWFFWEFDIFGYGVLVFDMALAYILLKHYREISDNLNILELKAEKDKTKILNLEKQNISSQLEALKSQINPHFLFNNFNTLVSLIEENPVSAVDFTQELSNVYRYILKNKIEDTTEVEKELDFLKSYIFLLEKRYQKSIVFDINIAVESLSKKIVPFSLQLPVENAIKHNYISSEKPLKIEIYMEENYLVVQNNMQEKKNPTPSTGLGISNMHQRYELLFHKEIVVKKTKKHFIIKIPVLCDKE